MLTSPAPPICEDIFADYPATSFLYAAGRRIIHLKLTYIAFERFSYGSLVPSNCTCCSFRIKNVWCAIESKFVFAGLR
jgi:hypothetical protein